MSNVLYRRVYKVNAYLAMRKETPSVNYEPCLKKRTKPPMMHWIYPEQPADNNTQDATELCEISRYRENKPNETRTVSKYDL